MIKLARIFSMIALFGIKDKAGKPLFYHAEYVANLGKTKNEKIVGYLHDTIEDNKYVSYNLIRFIFGKTIADATQAMTKDKKISYQDYIKNVKKNSIARQVKLNDIEHNSDLSRGSNMSEKYHNKLKEAKEFLLKE